MRFARYTRIASLALNRTQPVNRGEYRYQRIAQAALTSVVGKAGAQILGLIAIPLTASYLGVERYGVWATIIALLLWLQVADFGMGSGLTNAVAKSYGLERTDLARKYIASALCLLIAIAMLMAMLLTFIWRSVDWAAFFQVQSEAARLEVGPAMAVAFLISVLSLPLSIIDRVYDGYQSGAVSNLWLMSGNIVSLVFLVILSQVQVGVTWLIVGVSGGPLLIKVLNACWLFGWYKPELRPSITSIDTASIRELLSSGGMFFVLQIAAILLMQSANPIIAFHSGAAAVSPYNISWRLFGFALFFQSIVFTPLWAAYAEASVRGDAPWIRRAFWSSITISTITATLLIVPLTFASRQMIVSNAGAEFVPPFLFYILLSLWCIMASGLSQVSCYLNSQGVIKQQALTGLLAAIANISMASLLVQSFGIVGVIASLLITQLLLNAIPMFVIAVKRVRALGSTVDTRPLAQ